MTNQGQGSPEDSQGIENPENAKADTSIEEINKNAENPATKVESQPLPQQGPATPAHRDVFVICDERIKITGICLAFLKEHSLNPIFLFDKKHMAQTLEQNCFSYPHISFAVIVLSAEEFVYPKAGKPADARLKVRQDVVFALGFLSGKYGRQNVFVLYQEQKSFLLPTPYHHVIYTPLDSKEIWKKELTTRLKNGGYKI